MRLPISVSCPYIKSFTCIIASLRLQDLLTLFKRLCSAEYDTIYSIHFYSAHVIRKVLCSVGNTLCASATEHVIHVAVFGFVQRRQYFVCFRNRTLYNWFWFCSA